MLNVETIKHVYFVGIGGIGMSALVRYFAFKGKSVYGYDRTQTKLTKELENEGITINYEDDVRNIPDAIKNSATKNDVLIVYTPAIPQGHTELNYFRDNQYVIKKRAEVLGIISRSSRCIGIAGTHGKTSVSTTTAYLLKESCLGCSAFLGGISKNYNTNFLYSDKSELVVVEADEFDRSFHQLSPHTALITSMDADHLDIYGSHKAVLESFYGYVDRISDDGNFIYRYGLPVEEIVEKSLKRNISVFSYSLDNPKSDFFAKNIRVENGVFLFDIQTPKYEVGGFEMSVPGLVNVENAVAAISVAIINGADANELKQALSKFVGVRRRFDCNFKSDNEIYIDDYAHHPEELKASISSIRYMYPNKEITGVFQPHLFSRTKDFALEFAQSLSLLDSVYLLDIYPAREEPIEGVSSDIIFENISITKKYLCKKEDLLPIIRNNRFEVLMTLGAGDIDAYVDNIAEIIKKRNV